MNFILSGHDEIEKLIADKAATELEHIGTTTPAIAENLV